SATREDAPRRSRRARRCATPTLRCPHRFAVPGSSRCVLASPTRCADAAEQVVSPLFWARSDSDSTAKVVATPVEVAQPLTGAPTDDGLAEPLPEPVPRVVDPVAHRLVEQVELGRIGEPCHAHTEQTDGLT